jgi:hypothetical protein
MFSCVIPITSLVPKPIQNALAAYELIFTRQHLMHFAVACAREIPDRIFECCFRCVATQRNTNSKYELQLRKWRSAWQAIRFLRRKYKRPESYDPGPLGCEGEPQSFDERRSCHNFPKSSLAQKHIPTICHAPNNCKHHAEYRQQLFIFSGFANIDKSH